MLPFRMHEPQYYILRKEKKDQKYSVHFILYIQLIYDLKLKQSIKQVHNLKNKCLVNYF